MFKNKILDSLVLLLSGCLLLFTYLFLVNLTGLYNSNYKEQKLDDDNIRLSENLILNNSIKFEVDGKLYYYNYDQDLVEVYIDYQDNKTIQVKVHTTNNEQVNGNKEIELVHGTSEYSYQIGFPAKTYTLVIKSLYNELDINAIFVNKKTVLVNDKQYTYTFFLNSEDEEIKISADHHESSNLVIKRVNGINMDLVDGINEFVIYIVSELGDRSKPYSVNVYKEIKLIEWSSDAHLEDLKIEGYDLSPVFIPEQYDYFVNVNQSNIELDFIKGHFGQSVEVIGDVDNLNEGENEIIVKVVSQNFLVTNEYTILVNKVVSKNFLTITSVSLIVIILTSGSLGLVYYLKRRNR